MEWKSTEGISLRDYFAAAALPVARQHLLDCCAALTADSIARRAYTIADSMLAARDIKALAGEEG